MIKKLFRATLIKPLHVACYETFVFFGFPKSSSGNFELNNEAALLSRALSASQFKTPVKPNGFAFIPIAGDTMT
jgi:hypothetical protein